VDRPGFLTQRRILDPTPYFIWVMFMNISGEPGGWIAMLRAYSYLGMIKYTLTKKGEDICRTNGYLLRDDTSIDVHDIVRPFNGRSAIVTERSCNIGQLIRNQHE